MGAPVFQQAAPNGQRRQHRAPRVVLVDDRRAEEGDETVGHGLIHHASVPMYLLRRHLKGTGQTRVHFCVSETFGHRGRVGKAAEERRDLLPFSFQSDT